MTEVANDLREMILAQGLAAAHRAVNASKEFDLEGAFVELELDVDGSTWDVTVGYLRSTQTVTIKAQLQKVHALPDDMPPIIKQLLDQIGVEAEDGEDSAAFHFGVPVAWLPSEGELA